MWCALIGWSLSMGSKWNCTVHVAITSGIKVLDQCHYLLYQLVYIWMSFIGDIVSLQPIQHPYNWMVILHLLQCKQRNVCAWINQNIQYDEWSLDSPLYTCLIMVSFRWWNEGSLQEIWEDKPWKDPIGTPHIFKIVEIFCILAGLVQTRSL